MERVFGMNPAPPFVSGAGEKRGKGRGEETPWARVGVAALLPPTRMRRRKEKKACGPVAESKSRGEKRKGRTAAEFFPYSPGGKYQGKRKKKGGEGGRKKRRMWRGASCLCHDLLPSPCQKEMVSPVLVLFSFVDGRGGGKREKSASVKSAPPFRPGGKEGGGKRKSRTVFLSLGPE